MGFHVILQKESLHIKCLKILTIVYFIPTLYATNSRMNILTFHHPKRRMQKSQKDIMILQKLS